MPGSPGRRRGGERAAACNSTERDCLAELHAHVPVDLVHEDAPVSLSFFLVEDEATVLVDDLARYESGQIVNQKAHDMGKLVRLAESPNRNLPKQLLPLLFSQLLCHHRSFNIRGCNSIHGDSERGKLRRETEGEGADRPLGR